MIEFVKPSTTKLHNQHPAAFVMPHLKSFLGFGVLGSAVIARKSRTSQIPLAISIKIDISLLCSGSRIRLHCICTHTYLWFHTQHIITRNSFTI